MSQVEREIDHTVDTSLSDDEALTTLTDRQEHRRQMQEIKRRTVKDGLMKLNVAEVSSAENSHKWTIDIEHPVKRDTIRIFLDKPMNGWTREYKLVRMMDWYDIRSQDPHQLEFHDIYMKKDPENDRNPHDWVAVQPPEYDPPIKTQIKEMIGRTSSIRPVRSNVKMYVIFLLSVILTSLFFQSQIPMVFFVVATLLGMALFEPPGDDR